MLKNLNIENIAVIEKADIAFSKGLNVLTGETGAGKSILVDSIHAVLGERTSKDLVRHGADNAYVTAVFDDVNDSVTATLRELGIPAEDGTELIVSRKITSLGKTSCRVNGVPCTASMLREIAGTLVNIHGQHDSQHLLDADYHYRFVDMTDSDQTALLQYQTAFKALLAARRRLKQLTEDADTKDRQLELLEYQIKEISDADVKIGERETLKTRRNIIMNAQGVMQSLGAIAQSFSGDEETSGVENMLASCRAAAESVSTVDGELGEIYAALDALYDKALNVKDMVTSKQASLDYSEEELESIEARLDELYRLSAKYGESEEEILSFLENAQRRRNDIVNSDEEIEKLSEEYDRLLDGAMTAAEALSRRRKALAKKLEEDVKGELVFLDMPKIRFVVQFDRGNLSLSGYDRIEFLISTNPGEPPKPLAKIASGGELSRIMLAIKNIIAKNDSVDTLIFDEIDTGVSGRASRKIGLKLKQVSAHTQVICVTHSAQIAAAADTHMLISKEYQNDKTYTKVTPLDFDERKRELARIMGGLEITPTLLQSAEELLNSN